MDSETRRFDRAPTKLEVTITSELEGTLRALVEDVSVGGLYVSCPGRLPVGTLCELALEIGGPDGDRRVEASGRVARVDELGMAIQLTELTADHYEWLRRFVAGPDPL